MTDLVERMRERSISWERAEYDKLQDYWMDAVKDGHLAADALEAKDRRIAELEADLGVVDAWRNKVIRENERLRTDVDRIESRLGKGWVRELAEALAEGEGDAL